MKMSKKQFGAMAATTASGKPSLEQIKMNDGMPDAPPAGKYKSTMNEYDSNRPKRKVMTRKSY